MESKTLKRGDFVIREGDDATDMFVLESGDVEVSHDEVDGTRQKIKRMVAPSTFGEIALLFNTKRTANIIATSECLIWSIDRRKFKMIMQNTNENEYIDRSVLINDDYYLQSFSYICFRTE